MGGASKIAIFFLGDFLSSTRASTNSTLNIRYLSRSSLATDSERDRFFRFCFCFCSRSRFHFLFSFYFDFKYSLHESFSN